MGAPGAHSAVNLEAGECARETGAGGVAKAGAISAGRAWEMLHPGAKWRPNAPSASNRTPRDMRAADINLAPRPARTSAEFNTLESAQRRAAQMHASSSRRLARPPSIFSTSTSTSAVASAVRLRRHRLRPQALGAAAAAELVGSS